MREGHSLHIGRHPHDDAIGLHRLRVEQNAAQHGGADDRHQHVRQHVLLVLHQQVERRLDDHRIGTGDGGQERRQDHGDDQLAPPRIDPIAQEALEQPAAMLVERQRGRLGFVRRGRRQVHDGALALWSSGSSRRCMWTTK
jgi:hypothetical protein